MSADIIRFIPRPSPGRRGPADFPTIAFRSAVRDDTAKHVVMNVAGDRDAKDRGAKGNVSRPHFARRDHVADHVDTVPSEYVPSDWSEK